MSTAAATLELRILDPEAWAAHRSGLEGHGGLMVPVPEGHRVELFQEVQVRCVNGTHAVATVLGRVVQLSSDGAAAVLFEGEAKAELLALDVSARTQPTADGPLWARYEALSKAEKIKLARLGNADARRRILRDPDQALHGHLLSNPGVTASEVVGWLRSGLAPKGMIDQIVKRSELASNLQVMEALVQDPRTPLPLALKMVPKISLDLCRRIAKAGKLRTQIVGAARKRVVTK